MLFDSADVGAAMEEDVSPAGFSGGENDISDSFSVDSTSDIDQSSADKERNVEETNVNIKQGGNVEHSKSNLLQSMNNDKDNEPSTIKQNTYTVELSTSNVVQSSI